MRSLPTKVRVRFRVRFRLKLRLRVRVRLRLRVRVRVRVSELCGWVEEHLLQSAALIPLSPPAVLSPISAAASSIDSAYSSATSVV